MSWKGKVQFSVLIAGKAAGKIGMLGCNILAWTGLWYEKRKVFLWEHENRVEAKGLRYLRSDTKVRVFEVRFKEGRKISICVVAGWKTKGNFAVERSRLHTFNTVLHVQKHKTQITGHEEERASNLSEKSPFYLSLIKSPRMFFRAELQIWN